MTSRSIFAYLLTRNRNAVFGHYLGISNKKGMAIPPSLPSRFSGTHSCGGKWQKARFVLDTRANSGRRERPKRLACSSAKSQRCIGDTESAIVNSIDALHCPPSLPTVIASQTFSTDHRTEE